MATTRKNWHATQRAQLNFGQRIADKVAATMGSWSFIIVQSVILTVWIILNVIAWISHWDPYPFILLNLALSFQAAYAAPFIMISQNRHYGANLAGNRFSRRSIILSSLLTSIVANCLCNSSIRYSASTIGT
jgi:uncharacterized membrane protein